MAVQKSARSVWAPLVIFDSGNPGQYGIAHKILCRPMVGNAGPASVMCVGLAMFIPQLRNRYLALLAAMKLNADALT